MLCMLYAGTLAGRSRMAVMSMKFKKIKTNPKKKKKKKKANAARAGFFLEGAGSGLQPLIQQFLVLFLFYCYCFPVVPHVLSL